MTPMANDEFPNELQPMGSRALSYTSGLPGISGLPNLQSRFAPSIPTFIGFDESTTHALQLINQLYTLEAPPQIDWQYKFRNKAQPILPFLYLGPGLAARDVEFLRQKKITMLLAIRDVKQAQVGLLNGEKVARLLNIESASFEIENINRLGSIFVPAIKTINEHLLKVRNTKVQTPHSQSDIADNVDLENLPKGKVLVYCETGSARSACVVIAYLVAMLDFSLAKASSWAIAQRNSVATDDVMCHALLAFEDWVQARRMVSAADSSAAIPHRLKTKRGIDDLVDQSDDDLDASRFADRGPIVPFNDTPSDLLHDR